MPGAADIAGQRFGLLVAVNRVGIDRNKQAVWLFACDCGSATCATPAKVRSGGTVSCGCEKAKRAKHLGLTSQHHAATANRKHGHCSSADYGKTRNRSSEYRTWEGMRYRCGNAGCSNFKDYGGRGIKVCDRWNKSFEAFFADMGKKPTRSHSIDRIDVNGNYEPSNCRWATTKEQAANKRPRMKLEH